MATISDLMTDLNHDCDNHFTEAELAVGRGEWGTASGYFTLFRSTIEQHFEVEETILFPALEEEGGTEIGQTHAFSKEHLRMRELSRELAAALERHDSVEYMNHSEALFALLEQTGDGAGFRFAERVHERLVFLPHGGRHLIDAAVFLSVEHNFHGTSR